jgi:hypothetical protein
MPEMQREDAILTSVYQKAKVPERYGAGFYDGPHKFDRDAERGFRLVRPVVWTLN